MTAAATLLTPTAVAFADVLAAVAAGAARTAEICTATGRISANIARDLRKLQAEGLVTLDPIALTDAGRKVLRAAEVADGAADFDDRTVLIPWNLLFPDPDLNPRKTVAAAPLEALARDMARKGWRPNQNLLVRAAAPLAEHDLYPQPIHRIVEGSRRWRAIGLGVAAGEVDPAHRVPCVIQPVENDAAHLLESLKANILREDVPVLEEAAAIAEWMRAEGIANAAAAAREIGMEPRTLQLKLSLLKAPPIVKAELERGTIGQQEALTRMRDMAGTTKAKAKAEPESAPKVFTPTARQVLLLVEIAHKGEAGCFNWVEAQEPALYDKDWTALIRAGFGMSSSGGGIFVAIAKAARDWLEREGWDPDTDPTALFRAREACGLSIDACRLLRAQGTFATQWLDAPRRTPRESPAEGPAVPATAAASLAASHVAPGEADIADYYERPNTSAATFDAEAVNALTADLRAQFTLRRTYPVHWSTVPGETLAGSAMENLASGHLIEAIADLAALRIRAGALGSAALIANACRQAIPLEES